MTKQRRALAYSAEYEFGDDNILTTTYFAEARHRNQQRVKQAHSVLNTEAEIRTVNNAKKFQLEQDRELEIAQQNRMLLERLERIHKKVPKKFDVSHHTREHLSAHQPTNYLHWQQEQERIAEENEKMKRRINETKSRFDTKQLAIDAAKSRYFSDQLSKADRRMHVKQNCKKLELQSKFKRDNSDSIYSLPPEPFHRRKRHYRSVESELHTVENLFGEPEIRRNAHELPRIRASHKAESKYAVPIAAFPTVTSTTKLIRASELLPKLGR